MTAAEFEGLLPAHKASLHLTHNDHKSNYETVAEYLADRERMQGGECEFVAEGEREKAIATNELWDLQWYPNTPVGFCNVYASSFPALVTWLRKQK